jgi:hypothetical protein
MPAKPSIIALPGLRREPRQPSPQGIAARNAAKITFTISTCVAGSRLALNGEAESSNAILG